MDSLEREESISHHVEVLMYHDTGDAEFRRNARRFAELWEDLVPESDEAETGQGEVLRAIGRLAGEDRRNGCANWDEMYEALVSFLRDHLPHEAVFSGSQQARIIHDLDRVAKNGREGLDPEEMRVVFGRLIVVAVTLVDAQSSRVPRTRMPRASVREASRRKPWWRFW